MHQLRPVVKLIFGLLTLWLALIWAKLLPRPEFLPPEMEIEPLTVVVGITAGILLGFWRPSPSNTATASATGNALEPSLQNELIANLHEKYEKRIGSKLAGRFPVNLRIVPSEKGTSDEAKANFITLQDEQIGPEIGEIFDQAKGRLLLVGLPGAGKTTLLLQLAVELLKRPNAGIPVLLNLATWRTEFATFDEWLRRILPNELGASKALTEKIRAQIPLILLLDGLDEVPEADRNSCLEALGQYGMKPEHRFALTSRIQEYADAKDAPVYSQVEVAPLTAAQIEQSLLAYSGLTPEAKPLLNAIQKDPLLKQAIENPFYLNTAQLLFASGKNWSEFGFVAGDVEGRKRELVERFVECALTHKEKRDYKSEKIEKWLNFLAGKMERSNLISFELSVVKPSWVKNSFIWMIAWIGYILPIAVIFIFSISYLVFGTFLPPRQNPAGPPAPRFEAIFNRSMENWMEQFFGQGTIVSFAQVVVIYFFIHSILFFRLYTIESITWKLTLAQQGLQQEIKALNSKGNILFLVFLCILCLSDALRGKFLFSEIVFLLILFFLSVIFLSNGFYGIQNVKLTSPYQRFISSHKFLKFPIFFHLIIRLLLKIESSLPFRLVYFLNEMSRRHLLEFDGNLDTETGGGSWRWRHRIIQEYFLKKDEP